MVTQLPEADRARIAAAVGKAEATTSVEIRLVLAHWSSQYGAFALIYPALLALIGGGMASAVAPHGSAFALFAGEALLFLGAVLALQFHALRRALVPPAVKRKAAWRHARLHYASIGLKQPHTKSALLLFCSEAERSVEILVDDEIAERLPSAVWDPVVAAFNADFGAGRVADAFVNAAASCSAILAPVFPPAPGQTNALPDALVEL